MHSFEVSLGYESVDRTTFSTWSAENVLQSTLSYPNETSKECIQFLNETPTIAENALTGVEIWRFFPAILLVSNQNNPFSNQICSTPVYAHIQSSTSELVFLLNWGPGFPQRQRNAQELSPVLIWRCVVAKGRQVCKCVHLFLFRKMVIHLTFIVRDQHHTFRKQERSCVRRSTSFRRITLCWYRCTGNNTTNFQQFNKKELECLVVQNREVVWNKKNRNTKRWGSVARKYPWT